MPGAGSGVARDIPLEQRSLGVQRGVETGGWRRSWQPAGMRTWLESPAEWPRWFDDLDRVGGLILGADQLRRQHVLKGNHGTPRRRQRRGQLAALDLLDYLAANIDGKLVEHPADKGGRGPADRLMIGGDRGRRPGEDNAIAFTHG